MRLDGSTRVAAVIGDPIAHSLSPAIHNAAFEALGLNWVFVAFAVSAPDCRAAIEGARALRIGGLSVTMPHKETAVSCVDELSDRARSLGALNAIAARPDGSLFGDSTDGQGFLDALGSVHLDPSGMRCVVLGAGGAARAVVLALAGAGVSEIAVVNRSADRARVAAALAGDRGRIGSAEDAEGADLVVQATPLGMRAEGIGGEAHPVYLVDPSLLHPGQMVVDLVYHPVQTSFLRAARAAGASTCDGVGMLVHQAARAFTLWTGEEAPVSVMEEAARRAIDGRLQRS